MTEKLPIGTEIYGVLHELGIETDHATAQALARFIDERESKLRQERDALAAEIAALTAERDALLEERNDLHGIIAGLRDVIAGRVRSIHDIRQERDTPQ